MPSNSNQNVMTSGPIRKTIIRYAMPILIGYFFQQLYNAADSLIVGNYLGGNALAAVTSTGALTFLLVGFFTGFSNGAGVVIAHHIGAKSHDMAQRSVHTAVALGIVLSILMTLVGVLFTPTFLKWMDTPTEIIDDASSYLRIYFAGSIGLIMYNMGVGILEASGDSRHPLYYLIFSSLLNVFLDIFMITVCHLGVAGAALATILCQILSAVLVMARLMRTPGDIHVSLKSVHFDSECLQRIVSYGLPTGLQAAIIDIGNVLIQAYINSFGAAAVAGIGAYSRIEGFMFLPVTAFSMAITTFTSQNMGAQNYDRVRKGMHFGILFAVILIEAFGVLIFTFAPNLISLFNREPDVVQFGTDRARVCAFFYCLVGFSHLASAAMRGLGKPMTPMVVMLVCWCAVRVVVLFTIGQVVHNIYLTHWLYPITWSLSTVVYIIYMRKLRLPDGSRL